MRRTGRGADLPYKVVAGVVPCRGGWLAATAKVQGVTIATEQPQVFESFTDVLDYKPAYQVIAMAAPIGLLDEPMPLGRTCDRQARQLLGVPRSAAIASSPARPVLKATSYAEAVAANGDHLNPVTWHLLRKFAEIDENMEPYWQRTVFEVHPELSFFQLNENRPVRYSKHRPSGMEERTALLRSHIPGAERILDAVLPGVRKAQVLDAAACLWTARRILSRGVTRLPEEPEWDSLGLRMEILR